MIRRERRVNRPQPPSKPRYMTVALAAGMFAVVPVGSVMSPSSQSHERPSATIATSSSHQSSQMAGNTRPEHG